MLRFENDAFTTQHNARYIVYINNVGHVVIVVVYLYIRIKDSEIQKAHMSVKVGQEE